MMELISSGQATTASQTAPSTPTTAESTTMYLTGVDLLTLLQCTMTMDSFMNLPNIILLTTTVSIIINIMEFGWKVPIIISLQTIPQAQT